MRADALDPPKYPLLSALIRYPKAVELLYRILDLLVL
jgi:hypothetical protein